MGKRIVFQDTYKKVKRAGGIIYKIVAEGILYKIK